MKGPGLASSAPGHFVLAVTLAVSLSCVLSGCMSIVNQIGFWTDSSVGHMTNEDEVVYGGTRTAARALWNMLTNWGPPEQTAGDIAAQVAGGLFFLVDTPLCLVADTLLLPLTLCEAWWLVTYHPGR